MTKTGRDPGAGGPGGPEAGEVEPGGGREANVGGVVEPELVSAPPRSEREVQARPSESITDPDSDLPVVARVVVEIRSDGRRTVARGAIEDMEGNRAAVDARGDSPFQLAWQLARSLMSMPRAVTRSAVRSLLPGRRRRRGDKD